MSATFFLKTKVRTVEDVERDIEKAELHVKSVEEELARAALSADAEQLTRLAAEHEQAKVRVETLLAGAGWLERLIKQPPPPSSLCEVCSSFQCLFLRDSL